MLEQLKNINNIYDLLALCSSYILQYWEMCPYEFALFDDDKYDEVHDAIDRYCYEEKEKGFRAAFRELRCFLDDYLSSGINIEKCYAIVKYIDDLVEAQISGRLIGNKGVIEYSAINGQYYDQVKIVPRLKNTIISRGDIRFKEINKGAYSLFRDRRKCACSELDKETVNYMIWDKKLIEKFPMSIYRIDEKNPIAKHFYERDKIVFAIAPLTNKKLDQLLNVKYLSRTFYIDGMKKEAEQELKQRYKNIFERCKVEDIDFLIFPEMLMTEEIIKFIQNNEKNNSPQIVVNGSIWNNYTNKAVITDGNGKEIFNYLKKEPFRFVNGSVEYKEHLDSTKNKKYTILEIEGIGRIGICICKDLVSEEVKLFHKYIGTDVLIVPAYTKSMDLQSSAEGLSMDYNCIVVVANACSALEHENEVGKKRRIGFVTLPAKCNTDRSRIIQRYYKDECMIECDCKCVGKTIAVDFCNTQKYDDAESYAIKESSF